MTGLAPAIAKIEHHATLVKVEEQPGDAAKSAESQKTAIFSKR
jgi:hypothetical protein